LRPTAWGSIPRRVVSTSGSSGMGWEGYMVSSVGYRGGGCAAEDKGAAAERRPPAFWRVQNTKGPGVTEAFAMIDPSGALAVASGCPGARPYLIFVSL